MCRSVMAWFDLVGTEKPLDRRDERRAAKGLGR